MTMLLGGRAAEQLEFGAVTTGASDDLRRASEIAGAMITDYAMGTTVTVTGRGSPTDERVSEQTLLLRDQEREDLLHEARSAAMRLLSLNRPTLDALAAELETQEVLERSAIERIVVKGRAAAAADRGDVAPRAATGRLRAPPAGTTRMTVGCSTPSTTSRSRLTSSTTRSSATASASACRWCTAR